MDKIKLNDLKKKLFIRSALIPVDGLDEILALNDNFSADEILEELFRKSLRAFEFHYPLVTEFRVSKEQLCCCMRSDGYAQIKSNFPLYLSCSIAEDQIILVPNATPKLRVVGGYPYPGSYATSAPIDYQRPFIYLGDTSLMGDEFYMRGIYSRPIVANYNPDKTFTDDSAIYWLNLDEGFLAKLFVDQCMVDLLDYIRGLNSNMSLPSLPVSMFQACDTYYQQLSQEVQQAYLQSAWRGDLLV